MFFKDIKPFIRLVYWVQVGLSITNLQISLFTESCTAGLILHDRPWHDSAGLN